MAVNNILALDIGEKRVGIARVSMLAKLPKALGFINNDFDFIQNLSKSIKEHQVDMIIVGLPRNMSGQETAQSIYVRNFIDEKVKPLGLEVKFQDETLSSVEAQDRLGNNVVNKGDIDSQAAVVILEDYLRGLE
jgi:putative Holliday junction resolvase